ncbi:MAG: hypothetical protein NZ811_04120 [Gammaproteobacteria bacterium]|nr:hypothetical protein [Gammaproteobacteria bacterium]
MKLVNWITKARAYMAILSVIALLNACATTSGGGYVVGPRDDAGKQITGTPKTIPSTQLSVLIPVFDPNIPDNSDDYKEKGIWPELRRAEANRFSVQLRDAIADTAAFGAVRVSPDNTATAHLYVHGKIIKSNGEDISISVSVTDISGKRLLKKTYKHRVREYALNDPRNLGADIYIPVFAKAANDIAKLSKRLKSNKIAQLNGIEEMRFAESFSPDYFSQYIKSSRSGKTKLLGFPSDDDSMLQRVRALRVRDQMFIDNIQIDYDGFRNKMNADYMLWQRQAYTESKAARKAAAEASAKMFIGILSVATAASLASDSNYRSSAYNDGVVGLAVAGVATIASGVQDSKQAKAHRESLSEMGRSLNIQLAPKVMEMEDRTVELTGTASEQYSTWREFLHEIYETEKTPNILL